MDQNTRRKDSCDDFKKPLDDGVAQAQNDGHNIPQQVEQQEGTNGVVPTALAIISCIMGGGIVSIPFAYAVEGVLVGISVQVCVIAAIYISCLLYLNTRNILSCKTEFGEIAEKCLGPISGIILNSLLVFAIFGIMALYMILFSQIAISLLGSTEGDSFFDRRSFYVLSLSCLIAPIVARKRIAELKLTTYILFIGVICLVTLLTIVLIQNGSYDYRVRNGLIQPKVHPVVEENKEQIGVFEGVVDSINIAVASQGFVIALFPIYSSMSLEARPMVMVSVTTALLFTMSTYTYLSIISIAVFGQENIEHSIFDNIKMDDGVASIMLRVLFMTIFFCNIPFVFFAGKVALVAVVSQCFFRERRSEESGDQDNEDAGYVRVSDSAIEGQRELNEPNINELDNSQQSISTSQRMIDNSVKKELPNWVYLLTCFGYLSVCALAAILIEDLTLIFGIIAGIAECTTVFILPSIFYLKACQMEDNVFKSDATSSKQKYGGGTFIRVCVFMYLIMGILYFVISNYFNISKMTR